MVFAVVGSDGTDGATRCIQQKPFNLAIATEENDLAVDTCTLSDELDTMTNNFIDVFVFETFFQRF